MKKTLILLACGLTAMSGLIVSQPVIAAEGGVTHYMPGALATIIDLPPTDPGWVIETAYLHYEGDVSKSRTIPIAGLLTAGIEAKSDAFLLGGFYTLANRVLGAHFSIGAFLPYVWVDVEAAVESTLRTARRSDSNSGIGDMTILPVMFAWESGYWQFNAVLPIYAPTGKYDVGRLANPGLNYWTFDPTVGVAYNHDKIGFNWALHGGFSVNTENTDTDYTSGEVFHVEASVQQLLPMKKGFIGLGAEAFYVDQVSGDSGDGARLGDFKGHTTGIGPVLTYLLPGERLNFVAELRWLPELDVERRLKGDYIWLKVVFQF